MNKADVRERFETANADEISTALGVTGWVPADAVDALLDDVDGAWVQMWTDDRREAFVSVDVETEGDL